MNSKSLERRRASEYNYRTGTDRQVSPDPFKADATELERAGDGKGMLDKMYHSSLNYWMRKKVKIISF